MTAASAAASKGMVATTQAATILALLGALSLTGFARAAGADSWTVSPAPPERALEAGDLRWRTWFWSEPGGPVGTPDLTAPGFRREFAVEGVPEVEWGDSEFSRVAKTADGIERVAYRREGAVYLAQRVSPAPNAGWRHEFVADTGLEWGGVALAVDGRNRVHLAYQALGDGGRNCVVAVREPYGLWTHERVVADQPGVALALDASGAPHLFFVRQGALRHGERSGSSWRLTKLPHGAAAGQWPSAAPGPDGEPLVAWIDDSHRLLFGRRSGEGWTAEVVSQGGKEPRFVASPEGGLAISFLELESGRRRLARFGAGPAPVVITPVPVAPAAPSPRRWPWLAGLPLALLAWRCALVLRRRRARRVLRAEAALVGGAMRFDVIVRDPRASSWLPASAGLVALTSRSPVLWTSGLRPGEAWLGAGWAVLPGRSGWVEARCGQVRLELAPEPGLWPWSSRLEAGRLLTTLRAAREHARPAPASDEAAA